MMHNADSAKPSAKEIVAAAKAIRGKGGLAINHPFLTDKYGSRIEGIIERERMDEAVLEVVEGVKRGSRHTNFDLGRMLIEPLDALMVKEEKYPSETYIAHFEIEKSAFSFMVDISKSGRDFPYSLSISELGESGKEINNVSLYRSYGNAKDKEPYLALYVLAHILNFGGKMNDVLGEIKKKMDLVAGEPKQGKKEKKDSYGHFF